MKWSYHKSLLIILIIAVAIGIVAKTTVQKTSDVAAGTTARAGLPRLLDLGSDKCITCKMMVSVLDDLAKEYKGKLKVEFIDVWKNRKAGEKYKYKTIPTQIFFDSKGKEIYRHAGYLPKKDIINKFKELGIDFKKASDTAKKRR